MKTFELFQYCVKFRNFQKSRKNIFIWSHFSTKIIARRASEVYLFDQLKHKWWLGLRNSRDCLLLRSFTEILADISWWQNSDWFSEGALKSLSRFFRISFFSSRLQRKLNKIATANGVTQGTILGPLTIYFYSLFFVWYIC